MKHPILSDEDRTKICDHLAPLLADAFVLYVKTLNFHWNMRGPQFFMFHKLLQEQYEAIAEANDELAERMRMLGGKAPGSMETFLKLARLKESKQGLNQDQMIQELVEDHQRVLEQLHLVLRLTDACGDQGTSDLLIERIRDHAKQAWLLRSHF